MAVCIEIVGTGERLCLEKPIWVLRNRNGLLRTRHRIKAMGVSDGEMVWSLGALAGYPEARIITRAEYEESLAETETDPELEDSQLVSILLGGSYETE